MKVFQAIVIALVLSLAFVGYTAATYDVVEIISLQGEIDANTPEAMRFEVETRVADNPHVKAVVLDVNSPGGGVYASQVLRDEINAIGVPVVAYCNYMCASGAVFAITAPSVNLIYASPATMYGSIGVIRMIRREELPKGFKQFKSGKFKQAGNTTDVAPGEDAYLQRTVDDYAELFYMYVEFHAHKNGRTISKEDWVHIKNAEIFNGHRAEKMGLIDGAVYRDFAISEAKRLGGGKVFTREELVKHPVRSFVTRFFK